MLINISNLYMEYGEKKLFSIESQQVYGNDKIGIVGENGAGKSTLLDIIAGKTKPLKGQVEIHGSVDYIEQLDFSFDNDFYTDISYKWIVVNPRSGGEIMRNKISKALGSKSEILLCDEPTSNLDEKGILQLEGALKHYKGAVMMVSHDRKLLDAVCSTIWEISDGGVNVYRGNYSDYKREKNKILQNKQKEYDKYIHEKKSLEKAITERSTKAGGMTHTPRRMGNSEARLHRMDVRQRAGKVSGTAKNLKKRLDRLEVKEKPDSETSLVMTGIRGNGKSSRIAIRVSGLSFAYGENLILDRISFELEKGDKICITGDNGSGKTTLLECIARECEGIKIAPNNAVGYFRQNCLDLDGDKTIIETIMEDSLLPEHLARTVIGRLGIVYDDVYKKVGVLSGGERSKVKLTSLICRRCSILILDEPTNYLDIHVLEALEDMLSEYDGTLLFVSHDRYFRERISTRNLRIEGSRIIETGLVFDGEESTHSARIMLLELRKAELLPKISGENNEDRRAMLEEEYNQVLRKIKKMKELAL